MLTTAALKAYTVKDLAQMAKKRGIQGWHSMRKDQLVRTLAQLERRSLSSTRSAARRKSGTTRTKTRTSKTTKPAPVANGSARSRRSSASSPSARKLQVSPQRKRRNSQISRKIHEAISKQGVLKDLSRSNETKSSRDRVVLMVRDPYWLHAYWELASQSVERAQVALAEYWHTAKPMLRLLRVDDINTADCSETVVREVEIHGGVKNWYLDVSSPPCSFRVEIGYMTTKKRFHVLARSNVVTTPRPGSAEVLDGNWEDVAENCDKIYAMSGGYTEGPGSIELQELFEERLRRPMGSPMKTRFGIGAENVLNKKLQFQFDVDAEMIVYGITKPDAYVTMAGEPVKLRPDGSFTARLGLPDRRQVVPVVASTNDGLSEQTIVLAVERNTKVMEPVVRDEKG